MAKPLSNPGLGPFKSAGPALPHLPAFFNSQPTLTIPDLIGNLIEGDGAELLSDSGPLSFADANADVVIVSKTSNNDITWSTGGTLDATLQATLVAGFSVTQSSWDYETSANLDFLGSGETITFSYTLIATDNSGAANAASEPATVTIMISGSEDRPVVSGPLVAVADEGSPEFTRDLLEGASDADQSDILSVTDVTYSVDGSAPLSAPPAGVRLVGSTIIIDPTDRAFHTLNVGEATTIVISYNVTDSQGESAAQTEVITIHGTYDPSLYFSAWTLEKGGELYKLGIDGDIALVEDINPAPVFPEYATGSSDPRDFTAFNGALYFSAYSPATGRELYQMDSSGDVAIVDDFVAGADGSSPHDLAVMGDHLYFAATASGPFASNPLGIELYKMDVEGVITLAADINPNPGFALGDPSSSPEELTFFNDRLYFSAFTFETGRELYSINSDGITSLVQDLYPGSIEGLGANPSDPSGFTEYNGALYFSALTLQGRELYRVEGDGSVAFVVDVDVAVDGQLEGSRGPLHIHSAPAEFEVFNGELYFSAFTHLAGRELFKIDANDNVSLVADVFQGTEFPGAPAPNSSSPAELTEFDGSLYFTAFQPDTGTELYRVDAQGTLFRVTDLALGQGGSSPHGLTVFDGALYFAASDTAGDTELYRLPASGEVELVEDLNVPFSSNPSEFFVF